MLDDGMVVVTTQSKNVWWFINMQTHQIQTKYTINVYMYVPWKYVELKNECAQTSFAVSVFFW